MRHPTSVIGCGYVGCTTRICFAGMGHEVTLADVDPCRVNTISERRSLIYEPGLEEFIPKIGSVSMLQREQYDIGDRLGYVQAIIDFALGHEETEGPVMEYRQSIAGRKLPRASNTVDEHRRPISRS